MQLMVSGLLLLEIIFNIAFFKEWITPESKNFMTS